jgi:hypothetical protein
MVFFAVRTRSRFSARWFAGKFLGIQLIVACTFWQSLLLTVLHVRHRTL